MRLKKPLYQALVLTMAAAILGLGQNLVQREPIPWIAPQLEAAQSIESGVERGGPLLQAVSLEQVKILYDQGVVFVDAREEEYYNQGHIPGAYLNRIYMELMFTLDTLQGKAAPVVIYCSDDGCGSSEDLAYDLQNSGFLQLYVFQGGWLEWSAAGFPVEP